MPVPTGAQDEVADLLSELIRINTSNPTHPERPAAEWVAEKLDEVGIEDTGLEAEPRPASPRPRAGGVAEKLDEVGIEATVLESEPGRASTVARISGSNPDRKPLLIHGHL